eukprot:NODE_459_length_7203_cov_0.898226.p4 type:complete len:264 gc:universal NODE_459_length_7203_cov_0.898226:2318-1527(-)
MSEEYSILSLDIQTPLTGTLNITYAPRTHARQLLVHLECHYTINQKPPIESSQILETQILWQSMKLPQYQLGDGQYMSGSHSYDYVFTTPNYSSISTKYFNLIFAIKAELKTSTLIFNSFTCHEIVKLHYQDPNKINLFKQPFEYFENQLEIYLDSRILNIINIKINGPSSFKLQVNCIQGFHYEKQGRLKRKNKILCQMTKMIKNQCEFTIIAKEGILYKNKQLKWGKYELIPDTYHEFAGVDHFIEFVMNGSKISIPILVE